MLVSQVNFQRWDAVFMPKAHNKRAIKPSEIGIGVLVFILASLVVILGTVAFFSYDQSMIEGIAVEAHGMLFDLLVIGVFTLWLNIRLQKSKTNSDYLEQIDDFRTWRSEEASYRIAGIIRRLSNNKHHRIDLYQCRIRSVQLRDVYIKSSNCWAVNFTDSNLKKVQFDKCKMKGAGFNRAIGSELSFLNCFLLISKFDLCKMNGAVFAGSNLDRASFQGATVKNANFKCCSLVDTVFDDADISGANFKNVKGLMPSQLLNARSIKNIILDDSLITALEKEKPDKVCRYTDSGGNERRKVVD